MKKSGSKETTDCDDIIKECVARSSIILDLILEYGDRPSYTSGLYVQKDQPEMIRKAMEIINFEGSEEKK